MLQLTMLHSYVIILLPSGDEKKAQAKALGDAVSQGIIAKMLQCDN
jgi:hypothetical protein